MADHDPDDHVQDDLPLTRRCATHDPSVADRLRIADFEQRFRAETRIHEADLQVNIPVAFIHVVDGDKGVITEAQRVRQIEVMNEAYEFMGIVFTYDEDEVVEVDDKNFFTMGHKSLRERRCKQQNQQLDPTRGLNFYTAQPGGGLLGWATFPVDMEGDPDMDGVVMLHNTLPGGSAPYDLGATAVHEVGHWLGLFHTFQDGCGGLGDQVVDTPAHAKPNFGTPPDDGQPYNLCADQPTSAECPIHNYMNYVDDAWMREFTAGQKDRVWAQIGLFRYDLLTPPAEALAADTHGARMANVVRESGQRYIW